MPSGWESTRDWIPVYDVPILIWRAVFTADDYPVYGRYCSCCDRYIYSEDGWVTVGYADDATFWRDAYSGPHLKGDSGFSGTTRCRRRGARARFIRRNQ